MNLRIKYIRKHTADDGRRVSLSENGVNNMEGGVRLSGGAMDRHMSANAGGTGLSPDLGRSYMLWGGWAHAPQLLSLRALEHTHHNY